jgi:hypothetical protein
MGTAWHNMWWSLVLTYQPAVRGSCDGRTAEMFSEAVMAKPWDGVGTSVMDGTPIRHKRGLLGGCAAHTSGEASVGMLQAR